MSLRKDNGIQKTPFLLKRLIYLNLILGKCVLILPLYHPPPGKLVFVS
jgi:hypothetical protein